MTVIESPMMNSEEIKAEYTSSLKELKINSKPLISFLTMLAEDNVSHAAHIVAAIEEHLEKDTDSDAKLPVLYLIDCITKNIGRAYATFFSQNIVKTFCSVFKVVDEKTRAEMFKLRQTWNEIFPAMKLYAIDVQINALDPAWPVTAKPPPNSIHFNPKFLATNAASKPTPDTTVTPVTTETMPPNLDSQTFAMQQKLIQKQKELIELQQKKLELELLQTQVRLQKQLKNTNKVVSSNNFPQRSQNILLKPEVAKQLLPTTAQANRELKKSGMASLRASQAPMARITPVNSALVAAAANKPSRDPRLLRQQNLKANNGNANSNSSSSSSVSLGSKTAILDSDKNVTNKMGVRDNHNEPRLVTKDSVPSPTKSDNTTTIKSKPFPKSRVPPEQKVPKPRRNIDSDSKTKSLLDSPTKNRIDKGESSKSLGKSPQKHKKKDYVIEKKIKESKRDRDNTKGHKGEGGVNSTAFKGPKGMAKNRNYMRRNRAPSYSPEPPSQDVDLRMSGPPEKQPRFQQDAADDKNATPIIQPGMDVDLRQPPAPVSKKRLSTEVLEESSPKKSKAAEMFDVLFGNEDTDLRQQLPPVVSGDRPPTPPPPIISLLDKDLPKKTSNLDAIRAKLANATGRDKILAKSFRKKRPQEDEDLRVNQTSPSNDKMKKIIISSDDEQCIKAGTMTKEQEKQLMNKIIAQIEHQKLREAQRKDKEESTESLQPVSDEELEFNDENDAKFGDRDDRVNPPQFSRDTREPRRGGGPYWRGNKRRHWEQHPYVAPSRGAIRPWIQPPVNPWRPIGPTFNNRPVHPDFVAQDQDVRKSPEVPVDLVVDSVNQDDIKTINIDGVPRDIRYYDESAIVFMNWDDPREISFQNGNRRVIFDDKDIYVLSFNEGYKDVSISGIMHTVRLGAPSREIFIDSKPYECYFGGPGITIDLNGQMTTVKLDGPPPQVKIGNVKRLDLVAGKVNLIIDAKILVPVFLDAKVQKFVIDGETHTLKFVDALKTVLINDVPFKVEFGGLPKPITVHDKKHFIRFSVLPRGVKPGFVNIKDMEGTQRAMSPAMDENSQERRSPSFDNYDINEPALPVFGRRKAPEDDADRNSNSPHFFQNFMQQNNLDVLSSVITSSVTPATTSGGYQIGMPLTSDSQSKSAEEIAKPAPVLPASLNINELFQKLVATGIVASNAKQPPHLNPSQSAGLSAKPPKRNVLENMKPVTFNKPETLKVRQGLLYEVLYSGMQCSSCGMRFPPEQSMHYSQHLDWHFRQNRKGKKNIRVAASRKWYYSLADWKNYEEIEDLEEREKNYFDQQQSQVEGAGDNVDEEVEIPSVPAIPDVQDVYCEVCQDKFDQFFNEDKEEWHLRNAVRADDKTYHPLCYEDYQASLLHPPIEADEVVSDTRPDDNIPGLEIVLDDDDDDDLDEKGPEVLIEESDESKPSEDSKVEDTEIMDAPDEDDDVILNEVAPERIELDDDDDYKEYESQPLDVPVKVEKADDDGFVDVEEGLLNIKSGIKIKSEPIDPDDLMVEEPEEPKPRTEIARTNLISSIDGNIEPVSNVPATTATMGSKIKINISKPLPVIAPKETKEVTCDSLPSLEPVIDPSQPLPPGEEPVQLNIKPSLRGVKLKKCPPVRKGSELTGMCSIM